LTDVRKDPKINGIVERSDLEQIGPSFKSALLVLCLTAELRDSETGRLLDCDFAFLENVFSAGATFAAATKATAIAHTHWHLASPIHPQTATHTGAVREREH